MSVYPFIAWITTIWMAIPGALTIDNGCWKQTDDSMLVYVSNQYSNVTNLGTIVGRDFLMTAYSRERRHPAGEDNRPLQLPCRQLQPALDHLQRKQIHFFYPASVETNASDRCTEVTLEDTVSAITQLVTRKHIDQTAIFYADEYSLITSALVERFKDTKHLLSLWATEPDSVFSTVPTVFKNADTYLKTYILLVNERTAKDIIRAARAANMTYSDWMFITPVPDSRRVQSWEEFLVAGERVLLIAAEPYINCPCDIMVFSDASRRLTLNVMTLRREEMETVGTWEPSRGLETFIDDFWYFEQFQNKTFKIATIELSVFHYTRKEGNTTVWDGIAMEMLRTMAQELNFTYEIVPSVDGKWGAPEGNDSWNGMVGMVYRKEVDFAFAKFTISAIRDTVVDFATPFWYEPTVIVMSKPGEDSVWIYAGPFTPQVWYYFVSITPLCGALVAALLEWERALKGERRRHALVAFYHGAWYTFGAFMQQSWDYNPVTMSLRFLVGFWWFFVIVVMATYTGNLIAVLAVPKTTLPVQTLSDLAEQSQYKYGVMDGSALHTMFASSGAEIYKRLYERSISEERNRVGSHQEGLERVKTENYIYIGEKTGVASVVYSDCDYALGREHFNPGAFAAAFPEDSKYLPIFNEKFNSFTESGIIEKWKRYYYPFDRCSQEAASKARMPDPANLRDTQGAVFILGLGLGLALLVLLVEVLSWAVHAGIQRSRRSREPELGYTTSARRVPTMFTAMRERLFHVGLVAGGIVTSGGAAVDRVNADLTHNSDIPKHEVVDSEQSATTNGFIRTSSVATRRASRPTGITPHKAAALNRNGSVYSYKF